MLNQVGNKPSWRDKLLEAGTRELGIDCSVLISVVSDLMIDREMAVSIYIRAIGDTKLPEEVWKKIAEANGIILYEGTKREQTSSSICGSCGTCGGCKEVKKREEVKKWKNCEVCNEIIWDRGIKYCSQKCAYKVIDNNRIKRNKIKH